jgi:prevent-host-death family protein
MALASIHEAKTNLSRLIEKAERGEEVLIARGKKPVVRLVPIKSPPNKRVPGLYKDEFTIGPSFFEQLPPEELKSWE